MSNYMDLRISRIIQDIIRDFGLGIFAEPQKAGAVVKDYFSGQNLIQEQFLLWHVVASGAMAFVATATPDNYADGRRQAYDILTGRELLAETLAQQALEWFDLALGCAPDPLDTDDSPVDALLDENNTGRIVLYSEKNERVEFEQIAVIPIRGKIYAILRPLVDIPEMEEDEALVFAIEEYEDEQTIVVVQDDRIVDEVFEEYYRLLRAEGIDAD